MIRFSIRFQLILGFQQKKQRRLTPLLSFSSDLSFRALTLRSHRVGLTLVAAAELLEVIAGLGALEEDRVLAQDVTQLAQAALLLRDVGERVLELGLLLLQREARVSVQRGEAGAALA